MEKTAWLSGVLGGMACTILVFMSGIALGSYASDKNNKRVYTEPPQELDDDQENEFRTEAKIGF